MADKAFVTPNVLKWARESARMSLETAAAKINVSPDKLNEWENGEAQPTIRQAETLAKAYKRPFALFFLPEVPRDFLPLQDFRRQSAKELGTGSVFIIREIQQKQAWISDVNESNQEEPLAFVGRFTIKSNPQTVAKDILSVLEINPAHYSSDKPIKEWIDKAEAKGIFISRTSFIHSRLKLDSEEMQGFAIADRFAPFVFINSEDWDAPQLFTLVHELAHIWIAASGISSDIEPQLHDINKLDPIELFCNEVAANALMPAEIVSHLENPIFESSVNIFKSAKKLGVSSFALLVRAFNMNIINQPVYTKLKKQADADFKAYLIKEAEKKAKQKEKTGGPNPYLLRLNKNSRLFTQIVLDAFRGGRIAPTEASNLLNTQVNNFPKLEACIYS
ncbi:XRE family transcriptional regulator [Mucilaginibacter sp. OK283]|jgi:Zn-dependent peptidase ImmA (M78 family)/transcriptional regulator with XRE-family HTH domain|uniref:XRE family transcriptional regulator n=1 Tax=Mucilaginibacter sp. OK283 TaxID=1881049 RepID=UPI0008CC5FCC|nr:XRE family transcriptional regulator [Mucilaginibacter sp. OK283]SEO59381.1 Zn-dependent peptidase ImmA, M78 family [Mucilaginibacter sp. OK283]